MKNNILFLLIGFVASIITIYQFLKPPVVAPHKNDIKIKNYQSYYYNNEGTFIDYRDNKVYNWIKIGNQIWMAENLKYLPVNPNYYKKEIKIYSLNDYKINTIEIAENSVEYKENGVSYNYNAAMDAAKIKGWRLPSDLDWKSLEIELGMNKDDLDKFSSITKNTAYRKILKSTYSFGNGEVSSDNLWTSTIFTNNNEICYVFRNFGKTYVYRNFSCYDKNIGEIYQTLGKIRLVRDL